MSKFETKRTANREFMILLTNFLSYQFKAGRESFHSVRFNDDYDQLPDGTTGKFNGYLLMVRLNSREPGWTLVQFLKDEPVSKCTVHRCQYPYHASVILDAIQTVCTNMDIEEALEKKEEPSGCSSYCQSVVQTGIPKEEENAKSS